MLSMTPLAFPKHPKRAYTSPNIIYSDNFLSFVMTLQYPIMSTALWLLKALLATKLRKTLVEPF